MAPRATVFGRPTVALPLKALAACETGSQPLKARCGIALWARIALGVPFGPSDLEVIRVPELTIDTVPQQYVAVDGEVIKQTPIRVSVTREALHLMTPRGFAELKIEGKSNELQERR